MPNVEDNTDFGLFHAKAIRHKIHIMRVLRITVEHALEGP